MLLLASSAMPAGPILAQDKAEPGPRAVVSGAYRRPLGGDPATLDPVRTNDIYGRAVTQQIFDGLVRATEPVLGPIRAVLPPMRMGAMGLDLSPIVVFLLGTLLLRVIC